MKLKHWVLMHLFAHHRAYQYDWQDGRGPIQYRERYNGTDYTMQRPIYAHMSVAPPYAKMIFV
jgi:hypothetical protein